MKKALFLFGMLLAAHNISSAQCEPVSTLNENFDSWTTLDACWSVNNGGGSGMFMYGEDITFYSFNSANIDMLLVTPEVIAGDYNFSFDTSAADAAQGSGLTIGILTDPSDLSTFTAVSNVVTLGTETVNQQFTVSLTENTYLGIKVNIPVTHGAVYVDNVLLELSSTEPSCEPVSTLNENFDNWTTLDACWSVNNGGGSGMFMYGEDVTFYSFNSANVDMLLVTPEVIAGDYNFSFDTSAADAAQGSGLTIGILTDPSDLSTFTAVSNVVTLGTETVNQQFTVSLTENAYLGIKVNIPVTHGAVYVDNVVLEASASVSVTEKSEFRIYPNPATSILNIETNSQISSVEIFDMTGRKVAVSAAANIDITSLNQGTYILNITTEQGTLQSKFIKK